MGIGKEGSLGYLPRGKELKAEGARRNSDKKEGDNIPRAGSEKKQRRTSGEKRAT